MANLLDPNLFEEATAIKFAAGKFLRGNRFFAEYGSIKFGMEIASCLCYNYFCIDNNVGVGRPGLGLAVLSLSFLGIRRWSSSGSFP